MKTLFDIMISFGKIGFVALGGGHSMLKLIEHEAVLMRAWITQEEFISIVGSTFLFPGLTAVKLSAIIGYKAAGFFGLLLAIVFLNLPGLILAFIGVHYLVQSDSPTAKKLVIVVQYGALAMLLAAAYSIGEGIIQYNYSLSLVIASLIFFTALSFLKLSPFWGLLVFIAVAFPFA